MTWGAKNVFFSLFANENLHNIYDRHLLFSNMKEGNRIQFGGFMTNFFSATAHISTFSRVKFA